MNQFQPNLAVDAFHHIPTIHGIQNAEKKTKYKKPKQNKTKQNKKLQEIHDHLKIIKQKQEVLIKPNLQEKVMLKKVQA